MSEQTTLEGKPADQPADNDEPDSNDEITSLRKGEYARVADRLQLNGFLRGADITGGTRG